MQCGRKLSRHFPGNQDNACLVMIERAFSKSITCNFEENFEERANTLEFYKKCDKFQNFRRENPLEFYKIRFRKFRRENETIRIL